MTRLNKVVGVLLVVVSALVATALIANRICNEPEPEQELMSVELPTLEFDYNELPAGLDQPGPNGRFSREKMKAALMSVESFAGYWEVVSEATPMSQDDIEDLWAVMQRRHDEIAEAAGFSFPMTGEEWMRACTHFGKLLRAKGFHEGATSGIQALRLGLRSYWRSGRLETDDPRFIPLEGSPSRNEDGYRSYNPSTL